MKIGDTEETIRINNVFFCFIVCSIYLWAQIKYKPFLNEEMNNFSLQTSIMMLINIFLGLFSSISKDFSLMFALLVVLALINIIFIIGIFKKYLILQLITIKNTKKSFNSIILRCRKIFEKGFFGFTKKFKNF